MRKKKKETIKGVQQPDGSIEQLPVDLKPIKGNPEPPPVDLKSIKPKAK